MNELVDAHDDNLEERRWLKAKIADLEDWSHRNNLKLRGVPETVQPVKLQYYAKDMFSTLPPEVTLLDLAIDRIQYIIYASLATCPPPSHAM